MKLSIKKISGVLLASITLVFLTGCECMKKNGGYCKANQEAGLPIITCQPMDVDTRVGGQAQFAVEATGQDLVYQWYFRPGAPGAAVQQLITGTPQYNGGETPTLSVMAVNAAKVGFYWCEIDGTGKWGFPLRTRTRDAQLGITNGIPPTAGPSGPSPAIQVFPPQLGSMPQAKSGTVTCGSYCGWLNFQNSGLGFRPASGTTTGRIKVKVGTTYLSNSAFLVRWFDNLGNSGCTSNGADANQKVFSSDPSRIYCFTVYFVSPCPAYGSQIFFELEFA